MAARRWIPIVALLGSSACADERPESEDAASGISITTAPAEDDGIDPDAGDDAEVLDVGNDDGPLDAEDDGGEGGDCPCENVLDGIYVLHSTDPPAVYFYDPPANTFSPVGSLGCAGEIGATANSMAIDRQGNAWINYYSLSGLEPTGRMYRAPLTNLEACEDIGYAATGSWYLLGMGYAVDGSESSCDTLFVYNSDQYIDYPDFVAGGSSLAKFDTSAIDYDVLGTTAWPVGELSGTGDGRLFAFATVAADESILVQLDKSDGTALESIPLDLDITNAFAFAFWGGDVYFFTETSAGASTSKVTRLDYDNSDGGGLTVVNPDAGIHIAGAGVSTCASFTPPA